MCGFERVSTMTSGRAHNKALSWFYSRITTIFSCRSIENGSFAFLNWRGCVSSGVRQLSGDVCGVIS